MQDLYSDKFTAPVVFFLQSAAQGHRTLPAFVTNLTHWSRYCGSNRTPQTSKSLIQNPSRQH